MNQIYKTKKVIPLIFDYYPDKHSINLDEIFGRWGYNSDVESYSHTQAELNKNFNNYAQDMFHKFYLRTSNLVIGRGIMRDDWFNAIIYKEDGELRGALNVCSTCSSGLSAGKQTLVNKFFKSYGIKLGDIILMDYDAFTRKFIFPISFGINDLNVDVQRNISSEFLKQERELVSPPTQPVVSSESSPGFTRTWADTDNFIIIPFDT